MPEVRVPDPGRCTGSERRPTMMSSRTKSVITPDNDAIVTEIQISAPPARITCGTDTLVRCL